MTPFVPEDRDHVFYVYPLILEVEKIGLSRERICDALEAEGLSLMRQYQNIHYCLFIKKKLLLVNQDFLGHQSIAKEILIIVRAFVRMLRSLMIKALLNWNVCL